ncbi:MAG: single-stranded DNA-binding protein [Oscillospiraceae bacterium]|jgi:hypothetical protein|nr:single-stranded DNA-binding protein [Oscillospiraceae bacterium]
MNIYESNSLFSRQDIPDLLEEAKQQLQQLCHGEVFVLPELFYGYRWNRIPVEDRKLLGRDFLEFAMSEKSYKSLKVLEKNSRHQQQYVRIID